jgi:phospholipid/cholesterol/gamma-HCH transport system ATP-binding protein
LLVLRRAPGQADGVTTPKIAIRDLHLAFGPKRVLQGLDLDIAPGDSLALIGISGSGKSVLTKCILGLLRPTAGSIAIDGAETVDLAAGDRDRLMRRFGVLFQRGALFDSLTVWQNVAFGLIEGRGMPRIEARRIAIEKLAAVGLDAAVAELLPAELSGGMQKRVALARAIATSPEIVVLDDPVAGLDPILTASVGNFITAAIAAIKATAIFITQDIACVRRIARRVAMIHDGRIVWHGPVEMVDRSGNPYVDQLVHGRSTGPIRLDLRSR